MPPPQAGYYRIADKLLVSKCPKLLVSKCPKTTSLKKKRGEGELYKMKEK